MGGLNRNFDYLHIHDNVRRRVRNLETGVHPTGSHLDYYDSMGPTTITLISPGTTYWQAQNWQWQRRVGIVTMMGGLNKKSGAPAWSGDVKIGVLPADARPNTDLVVVIPASRPDFGGPAAANLKIETNGDMTLLYNSAFSGFPTPYFRFEGPTWAVN